MSPGDAWTHLLTAEIQGMKNQQLARQMKRQPLCKGGFTKICQGPGRIDEQRAERSSPRVESQWWCTETTAALKHQRLCLGAPILKITEYYSEAAGSVLSESQKSRGRDEL